MLKRSKKGIALIAALAMLMTMLPMGTAFAANTLGILGSAPTVTDDSSWELATVELEIDEGLVEKGDEVTFELPNDFVINDYDILIPKTVSGDVNELNSDSLSSEIIADNILKVTVNEGFSPVGEAEICNFRVKLSNVYVAEDFEGDIDVDVDASQGTPFKTGSVKVGVVKDGDVTLSVTNTPNFSDRTDEVEIQVTETVSGSLEADDESLQFKLPSGFEWDGSIVFQRTFGGKEEIDNFDYYIDGRDLYIEVPSLTTQAAKFKILAGIEVDNEKTAKHGDITVSVDGETDTNVSTLVVATYGDYDVTIDATGDVPTIVAGTLEQEVTDILIEEGVADSLTEGRTVILTLPKDAKWTKVDDGDSDEGAELEFSNFIGNDGSSIKYTVESSSSNEAAELTLEKFEVVTAPDFEGDLVCEVSGSAGLDGEVTLAEVIPAAMLTVDRKISVGIGQAAQAIGTITITENAAGTFFDDEDLVLDLPNGVYFAKDLPEVEVTDGDLDLGKIKTDNDDNQLIIPIESESSDASKITIKGAKITIDRTVAEGDVIAKLQGPAVIQANNWSEIEEYFDFYGNYGSEDYFYPRDDYVYVEGEKAFKIDDGMIYPDNNTAAKGVIATVGTKGDVVGSTETTFVIGSNVYTIDGIEYQMDVEPYVENGRTYMPVRYVAYALGIAEENILWDDATQTVTLIKDGTIIQIVIGDYYLNVNGVKIKMDVVPVLKNGRTMLPIRPIAESLGFTVGWDEATQTVTITKGEISDTEEVVEEATEEDTTKETTEDTTEETTEDTTEATEE